MVVRYDGLFMLVELRGLSSMWIFFLVALRYLCDLRDLRERDDADLRILANISNKLRAQEKDTRHLWSHTVSLYVRSSTEPREKKENVASRHLS
jgi:hypothetical protein